LLLSGSAFAVSPPAPDEDFSGHAEALDRAWVAGPPTGVEHAPAPPAEAAGDIAVLGQWLAPAAWEVIAIHSAMLSNGQVLQYSFPGDGPGSRARMWNPATGVFTPVDMESDIFCSGLTFLADGSLYVTGGNNTHCEAQGRVVTNFFDPNTQSWSPGELMLDGRWYPTPLKIGDGSVIITSGRNSDCESNLLIERYVPGSGLQLNGMHELALFPFLHLMPSGLIAHVGLENLTSLYDPDTDQWSPVAFTNHGYRCDGTSVLVPGYPNLVMIIGGGCPMTNTCEFINFSIPAPQWNYTAPMNHPRAHADVLILPDKTLLVVGGGTDGTYGNPQLIPELFDPQTQTWTELPPQVYGRMYHSTTVLLPDGRVLSAGQDNGPSRFFGEIYEPPYLFRGPRPQLTAVPRRVGYGNPFSIAGTPAAGIGAIGLIAPTTNTHSFNNSQRYVELDFDTLDPDALTATGPQDGNYAPPGYYMLFIVTPDGVPSIFQFVQVGPWLSGDIDGDGAIGIVDFLQILAAWGPCAGCDEDVNGDATVGILDLLLMLGNWT